MKRISISLIVFVITTGLVRGEDRVVVTEPNLDYKIGQMLMVGFRGTDVNENSRIAKDIRAGYVGGIVLFDKDVKLGGMRNIQSPPQLKKLTAKLQSISPVPLLIAIDQEGGKVSRLQESYGFAPTVSAQYLGKVNDSAVTYKEISKIAAELAACGINLNLAPIVDLNINPNNPVIGKMERSFSADANIVTRQAEEFIKAHHEQGVLCTLKHFPGHGSSKDDSHIGSVDITNTWKAKELKPYEVIIKDGMADAVMTGHLFNSHLDGKFNATLSRPIVTGLLREKLGYKGVVISDCLHMRAIEAYYKFEDAVRLAIEAGVDIILLTNNSPYVNYDENIASQTVEIVKKLVREGRISEGRINESYERIKQLKNRIAKQGEQN